MDKLRPMTEEEGRSLAARLTRIWEPFPAVGKPADGGVNRGNFRFSIGVGGDTRFVLHEIDLLTTNKGQRGRTLDLTFGLNDEMISLSWSDDKNQISLYLTPRSEYGMFISSDAPVVAPSVIGDSDWLRVFRPSPQFDEIVCLLGEWMPVFRRGCWLSGCPIDASATEKAEWMQGFSRTEIDEWELDF